MPDEPELRICFTGDLLLDRGVREVIEHKGAESLFRYVKDYFKQMDAVVVNFECAATKEATPVEKRFVFRAEPEWISSLHQAGITHAVLANNHSYDQGRHGMVETASHLKRNNITPVGFGNTQPQACNPVIIAKSGIRVAIFSSVWLTLERWNYLENEPGMCQCGYDEMCAKIEKHKKDFPETYVVVVLHWGAEYSSSPSADQKTKARGLISSGADAVVGHHPHFIQPLEIISSKPVFYSLGNFIFDQRQPKACVAGIAELTFTKKGMKYKALEAEIKNCVPGEVSKQQAVDSGQ